MSTVNTYGLSPEAFAAWQAQVQANIQNPTIQAQPSAPASSARTPLLASQPPVTSAASTALASLATVAPATSTPAVSAPATQPAPAALVLTDAQEQQAQTMINPRIGMTIEVARQLVYRLHNPTFVPAPVAAPTAPAASTSAPAAPVNPAVAKAEHLKKVYAGLSFFSGAAISYKIMAALVPMLATVPVVGWILLAVGLLLAVASVIVLHARHKGMEKAGLPTDTVQTLLWKGVGAGVAGAGVGILSYGATALIGKVITNHIG